METYAVINQKGGVGKTTTAHALGAALGLRGAGKPSVLFVDLDPQANLTQTLSASSDLPGALEVILREASLADAVQRCALGGVLASRPALAGADALITETGKEYRLREALESAEYDYCIIDTPPALGVLTINALTACNAAIVPAQADVYSVRGIEQLSGTIDVVRRYCNPKLRVDGILLTRFNERTVISRDIADTIARLAARLNTRLYSARIRENVAVRESQLQHIDIFSYAPRSNAAQDYSKFVEEVIKNG